MAKRTSKEQKPRKTAKPKQDSPKPGPHFSESVMAGMFGGANNAQELAYEAMDAMADGDYERAANFAAKAAELDRNCIDAMHILSQLGSETEEDLIENLSRTVDRAQHVLGEKYFRENEGYFWGLLETRPYMRAHAELAGVLYSSGDVAQAIEHWQRLLQLNPNDNQGLRYPLLGACLELGDLDAAEQVFKQYDEEHSAVFAWARLLWELLQDNQPAAKKTLTAARKINPHVEQLLTGRKRLPKQLPGYYSPGEPSEAYMCYDSIGAAWKKHRTAIKWLKENAKDK
ncbi:MAG: tetratricopeptide repeat protein [Planctomycetales bacterium]|nr:tetratricopeptide repeat protein [Planctomycetales bacterium]